MAAALELFCRVLYGHIKMDGPSEHTSVLQGLGLFKIWATIILAPLIAIGLIVAIVQVSRWQKDWTLSEAEATETVQHCRLASARKDEKKWSCDVPVSVRGLDEAEGLRVNITSDKDSVDAGSKFQVTYDPAKPAETLTADVLTPAGRSALELGLGVVLVVVGGMFVVNVIFRKSKTWQSVQGVFQGVDLAHNLFK